MDPSIIARGTLLAASGASPASDAVWCHPPYDHNTPIKAVEQAVAMSVTGSVAFSGNTGAVPQNIPKTMIRKIPINLALVNMLEMSCPT